MGASACGRLGYDDYDNDAGGGGGNDVTPPRRDDSAAPRHDGGRGGEGDGTAANDATRRADAAHADATGDRLDATARDVNAAAHQDARAADAHHDGSPADAGHVLSIDANRHESGSNHDGSAPREATIPHEASTGMPVVTIYTLPIESTTAEPFAITCGPGDFLWFTDRTGYIWSIDTNGQTSVHYQIPVSGSVPYGIAYGVDGRIWFADHGAKLIGSFLPTEVSTSFKSYALDAGAGLPWGITNGPDGGAGVWFTQETLVGRLVDGGIAKYPINSNGDVNVALQGIAVGVSDDVCFVDYGANKFGCVTSGVIKEYDPPAIPSPWGIASGASGTFWVTSGAPAIEQMVVGSGSWVGTPSPLPADTSSVETPQGIALDDSGNIWFADNTGIQIWEYVIGQGMFNGPFMVPGSSGPIWITLGPDKNMWFTTSTAIGRVNLSAVPITP
jgi:streptogramin lyase